MLPYQEAQDAFRKAPSDAAADAYNRLAWVAYMRGWISDDLMRDIQHELEAFWWREPRAQGVLRVDWQAH